MKHMRPIPVMMIDKFTCDRCGKEIISSRKPYYNDFELSNTESKGYSDGSSWGTIKRLDLCPTCQLLFWKALEAAGFVPTIEQIDS